MQLPEIRIEYAWLIDPVYRAAFFADREKRRKRYPSPAAIRHRIHAYRRAWKVHETSILEGICRATSVGFAEKTITVHIVGRAPRSVSYPLVTHARHSPDAFLDTLTHELIHHILVENTRGVSFLPAAAPLTRGEPPIVKTHVLVHAIHQYIYLDVLKDPARLRRDVQWSQKNPPYREAWAIIDRHGYRAILRRLRAAAKDTGLRQK